MNSMRAEPGITKEPPGIPRNTTIFRGEIKWRCGIEDRSAGWTSDFGADRLRAGSGVLDNVTCEHCGSILGRFWRYRRARLYRIKTDFQKFVLSAQC
jgi:hypothetical protein